MISGAAGGAESSLKSWADGSRSGLLHPRSGSCGRQPASSGEVGQSLGPVQLRQFRRPRAGPGAPVQAWLGTRGCTSPPAGVPVGSRDSQNLPKRQPATWYGRRPARRSLIRRFRRTAGLANRQPAGRPGRCTARSGRRAGRTQPGLTPRSGSRRRPRWCRPRTSWRVAVKSVSASPGHAGRAHAPVHRFWHRNVQLVWQQRAGLLRRWRGITRESGLLPPQPAPARGWRMARPRPRCSWAEQRPVGFRQRTRLADRAGWRFQPRATGAAACRGGRRGSA